MNAIQERTIFIKGSENPHLHSFGIISVMGSHGQPHFDIFAAGAAQGRWLGARCALHLVLRMVKFLSEFCCSVSSPPSSCLFGLQFGTVRNPLFNKCAGPKKELPPPKFEPQSAHTQNREFWAKFDLQGKSCRFSRSSQREAGARRNRAI